MKRQERLQVRSRARKEREGGKGERGGKREGEERQVLRGQPQRQGDPSSASPSNQRPRLRYKCEPVCRRVPKLDWEIHTFDNILMLRQEHIAEPPLLHSQADQLLSAKARKALGK